MLLVPESWPLVWWGIDTVRMPCPAQGCGAFSLYRRPNGFLECTTCDLNGLVPVQRAFDAYTERLEREQRELAAFAAEADEQRRKSGQ